MTPLRIGTRIRSLSTNRLGTVVATEYVHRGQRRVGVVWDELAGIWATDAEMLAVVDDAPPTVVA